MYITQLIIDLNTEIRCDSMCVVWGVCLGCITKHKTIFNLILSVEIYSWSQDKALSKKLTGHFGSWEYKTLNPNLAKHWTPRNSELHPRVLSQAFCLSPSAGRQVGWGQGSLLLVSVGEENDGPLLGTTLFYLHIWPLGEVLKPGLETPFPPKLVECSWDVQTSQQVFLRVLISQIRSWWGQSYYCRNKEPSLHLG